MKNFITKNLTTKKVIALWLVFVMMLTPLTSSVGGGKGTKADEPATTTYTFTINEQSDGAQDVNCVLPISNNCISIYGTESKMVEKLSATTVGGAIRTDNPKSTIYVASDVNINPILGGTLSSKTISATSGYNKIDNLGNTIETANIENAVIEYSYKDETGNYHAFSSGDKWEAGHTYTVYATVSSYTTTPSTAESVSPATLAVGTFEIKSAEDIMPTFSVESGSVTPGLDQDCAFHYTNKTTVIEVSSMDKIKSMYFLVADNTLVKGDDSSITVIATCGTLEGPDSGETLKNGNYDFCIDLSTDPVTYTGTYPLSTALKYNGTTFESTAPGSIVAKTDEAAPVISDVKISKNSNTATLDGTVAVYMDDTSSDRTGYTLEFTVKDKPDETTNAFGLDKSCITVSDGTSTYEVKNGTGSDTYKVENITLGTTTKTFTIEAKDYVGNEADDYTTNPVGAVDKTLTVTSATEGLSITDDAIKFSDSTAYIKAQKTFKIKVQSGYAFNSISVTGKKNADTTESTLWSYDSCSGITIGEDGLYTKTVEVKLPDAADKNVNEMLSGMTLVVKDNNTDTTKNTKTITLSNLFYDDIKPEVTNAKLLCNGVEIASDAEGINSAGLYAVDTDESNVYEYTFDIVDPTDTDGNAGSGIKDIKFLGECNTDVEIDETTYTIETNGGKLAAGTNKIKLNNADIGKYGVMFYVKVTDNAGNTNTNRYGYVLDALRPGLIKADMSPKIDKIYLKDASGNVVSWDEAKWNIKTNVKYTLYAEVSSGYNDMSLKLNDNAFSVATAVSAIDPLTKRYKETFKYELSPSNNIQYETMKVSLSAVKNSTETLTEEETLGKLIYDNQKPTITATPSTNWVKPTADVSYEIKSGPLSPETKLVSASYTVTNGTAGSPVDISVSGTSVKGKVSLTESSTSVSGTTISFTATDEAGNTSNAYSVTAYVDGVIPTVNNVMVNNDASPAAPLTGTPVVTANISDNVTIASATVTTLYNGKTLDSKTYTNIAGVANNISQGISYTLPSNADGNYEVKIDAVDMAGNAAMTKTISFAIDNTVPVVDAAISGGTAGGKQTRADGTDYYYSSNVTTTLKVTEANFSTATITVKDNGNVLTPSWTASGDEMVARIESSTEGKHVITIEATDAAGNVANSDSVDFIIDKSAPTISLIVNGLNYTNNTSMTRMTSDVTVNAVVSDSNEDAGDFHVRIVSTKPDQATNDPSFVATGNRSFSFSEEGEYTVYVYSVDKANNRSETYAVSFRLDKTAPVLTITGANGNSRTATSVTFTMVESFWWDATGTITIYRKASDSSAEALYKTVTFKPTANSTSMSEAISDTGSYRFEFAGNDSAGHKVTTNGTLYVDKDAPVIKLEGVSNYDVTKQTVSLSVDVTDDFYASKTVSIKGTKTDINGKVSNVEFDRFNQTGNPTSIDKEFSEDGIYDVEVTSTDKVGNSTTEKVHFTVDKSKPQIGDLSEYDGKILKEFTWDKDLDELVSDLTVCDTHMYLNGTEYDGVSDIEDGSYTLLITSEDELGNSVEKSVSFVLDTKAPVFIVTGVEDGQVQNAAYTIGVSLQLAEDELTSLQLNGEDVLIADNAATINVTEKGDYTLTMTAKDEAGNEASQTIKFTYGEEKSNWWIWLLIALGVVVLGGVIVIAVKKNGKEE